MKSGFRKFVMQLLVISGLLLILWSSLYFTLAPGTISPATPVMIVFFFFITSGIYHVMLQSAANRFPRFVNSFMVVTLGKILLFSILLVIYAFINRADFLSFTLAFLALYLIYTIAEVMAFLRDLKSMERK